MAVTPKDQGKFHDPDDYPVKVKNHMVKFKNINLHTVDYGGQGETMILVHGMLSNARAWDGLAEKLCQRYRVIAYDLPGRGYSDEPDFTEVYDPWNYVDQVKAVLDYFGVEKTIYAGHSMGASIGVCFANRYPESLTRLILVDIGMPFDPRVADDVRALMKLRTGLVLPNFEAYLNALGFPRGNIYFERFCWHSLHHYLDGSCTGNISERVVIADLSITSFDFDKLYPNIKVPVLLLRAPLGFPLGEETIPMIDPEKGRKFIKSMPQGSRFAEIEGSNHISILNFYGPVLKEFHDFLNATG